jgi:hypothetical protein
VYCDPTNPPELPSTPEAGFTPILLRPPQLSLWLVPLLFPVAWLLYLLILDIAWQGYFQPAVVVNILLMIALFVGYGWFYLSKLLGRANFFRLLPGHFQLIRYRSSGKATIEDYDLRQSDVVLDLSGRQPGFTILNAGRYHRVRFRLPPWPEAVQGVLRATLSTASLPLGVSEELVE